MKYYINDYAYEKHHLLVEEGDKNQKKGIWLDMPQLYFAEGNVVKAGYTISLVNGDVVIVSFFNDVILQAKDGHKLSVEEITIFMLLLISETILHATDYLMENHNGETLIDVPNATPESIMEFVQDRVNGLN